MTVEESQNFLIKTLGFLAAFVGLLILISMHSSLMTDQSEAYIETIGNNAKVVDDKAALSLKNNEVWLIKSSPEEGIRLVSQDGKLLFDSQTFGWIGNRLSGWKTDKARTTFTATFKM